MLPFRIGTKLLKTAHLLEDEGIRLRINGQLLVVIAKPIASFVVFQLDVSLFEFLSVRLAKNRQQHLSSQLRLQCVPINIEKVRVFRRLPVAQHILPPRSGVVPDPHVIGNNIKNQRHTHRLHLTHACVEFFFGADLRVECVVVGDIVTVRASGPGFQDGRKIAMRNPELIQIGQQPPRIFKTKSCVQLQTVGADGSRLGLLL